MAATLTDSGELTYVSFPIEKTETTDDGDLVVYGKASDGAIDHDMQIVDPTFTSDGIQKWLATGGNLRVQHNAQRDPAGIGLEAHTDPEGATWVKSLVIEPVAKRLVSKGALRAYSVGIARPTIVRDAVAKGGRITSGEIVEISLVDRPANARCGISLVKSADDGTPEYVGKVFGADDAIAKALDGEVVEKAADTWTATGPVDISNFQMPDLVNVDLPASMSLSVSPADIAMMNTLSRKHAVSGHYDELALKAIAEAESAVYKRDIDTATRRRLAADGKALPNLSYPIENAGDLGNAAHLARTGHGDVAAARRLIARRARELGVANPLDESDDVSKSETVEAPVEAAAVPVAEKAAVEPEAVKEAAPDVTKDPEPEADPKPKPVKKAKGGKKKMPPWLNKPKDDDDSDDGKGDSDDDSCKSAHVWEIADPVAGSVECAKCHTTPAQAGGVAGVHDMTCAPVPDLMESDGPASTKGATPASASGAVAVSMEPVPAHREPDGAPMEALEDDAGMQDGDNEAPTRLEAATGMKAATSSADLSPDPELAALIRFKNLGIDEDLGRLHDLTCPAYSPDMAAKYHPYSTLPGLIDSGVWQRKTLAAAAGPLEKAVEMAELWQAVHVLKNADQAALNDWRLEVHKAFRDANPGPGSFPTPGCVSPQRYNRPVLTDGRGANAVDYSGPTTAPMVATSAPNAQDFDRPPLSSAQESPSPSFMKGGGAEYPAQQGVPQRITYEMVERDKARRSLSMLHDHLNHMFPSACPMLDQDAYRQPEARPVPAPAGIGKGIDPEPAPAQESTAAVFKATPEDGDLFADAKIYKGFKKMRKKLGKKVLSGSMTVDEARAKLGRQFAQKGTQEPQEAAQKGAALQVSLEALAEDPQFKGRVRVLPPGRAPEAAPPVAAAFDPEVVKSAVAEATSELKELLVKQQDAFTTKLAEQQRVIDAIADQPDPGTATFSGLAYQQPVMKSRRPAGVNDVAQSAAQARDMIRRGLQNDYYNHSDPAVREKAAEALARLGVDAAP